MAWLVGGFWRQLAVQVWTVGILVWFTYLAMICIRVQFGHYLGIVAGNKREVSGKGCWNLGKE